MKNEIQLMCEDRLKNVLVRDKEENPAKISNILKSEILYVLKNYMDISISDLDLDFSTTNSGYFLIEISAKTRRLKSVSSFFRE